MNYQENFGEINMTNTLSYPYNIAFERGHSIDYKVGSWSKESDHSYVEKFGYKSEMMPDCTYYAKGLPGFSLSSYGDWGTFYSKDATDQGKEMFLDMVEKDIIRLWRIRAYIREPDLKFEGLTNVVSYDYDGQHWTKYDKMQGWIKAEDPFK